jgi:DNA-binding response OmpR family regulator
LEVLRGMRSKKPGLPVLIVTAAAKVEERVRGLDAGADDCVAKPFVFAKLSARIRAVLGRGSPFPAPRLSSKSGSLYWTP